MKIKFVQVGRLTRVEPFPEFLEKELSFRYLVQRYTKRGDIHTFPETENFWIRDAHQEDGWIFSGFIYRAQQSLLARGYSLCEIEIVDARPFKLEAPVLSRLEKLHDWEKDALAYLLASNMGVIDAASGTGKTYLIKQLCRIFPNTPIIITGHDSVLLRDIYQYLRHLYPGEVAGLGVIGGRANPQRLTVTHIKSLPAAAVDAAHLLIYDEVHGAAAPERSELLSQVAIANMYGFSASPQGRLDRREPFIEALFGPVIYRKPYREAAREGLIAPIRVIIHEIHGPAISADTYARRQRYGIIRNHIRNCAIARAAEEYSDYKQLIIAQDNLEHVFRLKALLPDHAVVYAPRSLTKRRARQLDGMGLIPKGYRPLYPGEDAEMARHFREGRIVKAISTSVWDEGVDLPSLEVLIRADGIPGRIEAVQLPGRVSRAIEGKRMGIVVDFLDNFGRNFLNRANRRIQLYRAEGYSVEFRKPEL